MGGARIRKRRGGRRIGTLGGTASRLLIAVAVLAGGLSVAVPPAQADVVIVDDPAIWGPAGPTQRTGIGWDNDMWTTGAEGFANPAVNGAEWVANISGGTYNVEVFIPHNYATATVNYYVRWNGGQSVVTVNQLNYNDQWVSLGTYAINGPQASVGSNDSADPRGSIVGWDAVRWTNVDTATVGQGASNQQAYVDAYNRAGGAAAMGQPLNATHSWGPGCNQDFNGGTLGKSGIMSYNCSGAAYAVTDAFWGYLEGNFGGDAAPVMGYPYNDEHRWGDGWVQDFDHGQRSTNILMLGDRVGQVHDLLGGIRNAYVAAGGAPGSLGFPTTDEYDSNGGKRQDFEGGSIIWNATAGARVVPSDVAIVDDPGIWGPAGPTQRSGIGWWGDMWTTGAEGSANPAVNGAEWVANVRGGNYNIEVFIPHNYATAVVNYYVRWNGGQTAVAVNQLSYNDQWVSLGTYAIDGPQASVGANDSADPRGSIVGWDAVRWTRLGDLPPAVGQGASNQQAYIDAFNRAGGGGAMGSPQDPAHAWDPGCIQDFNGGSLGKSAIMSYGCSGGAYAVTGALWAYLEGNFGGNATTVMGYPYNDKHAWGNGVAQDFDHGQRGVNTLLLGNNVGQVHDVLGAIRDKFISLGGAPGSLGFPTTDEYDWNGEKRQDFEGGSIVWDDTNGARLLGTALVPAPTLAQPIASPSDPLLMRTLPISAAPAAGQPAVARYEYGWSADLGATAPTSPLQRCVVVTNPCRLDFQATTPDSTWLLLAHTIDAVGNVSVWSSLQVLTPKKPLLVAIGDSITSGHHRDTDVTPTICNDPNYGYPRYAYDIMQSKLPPQWQAGGYFNYARSGFSTDQIIHGGGADACGSTYSPDNPSASPLGDASNRLQSNAGSWNRIVVTGGIDDTNWVDVLSAILKKSALGTKRRYKASDCEADLSGWNGWGTQGSQIARDVTTIAGELTLAGLGDPSARLEWLSYYNIAGTGPAPLVCKNAFTRAMNALSGEVRLGLSKRRPYVWVNTGPALSMRADRLQPFFVDTDTIGGNPGWPHPNSVGAQALASLVQL